MKTPAEMTDTELNKRVEKANKRIEKYPEWVKASMVFHGSGVRRGQINDTTSYSCH